MLSNSSLAPNINLGMLWNVCKPCKIGHNTNYTLVSHKTRCADLNMNQKMLRKFVWSITIYYTMSTCCHWCCEVASSCRGEVGPLVTKVTRCDYVTVLHTSSTIQKQHCAASVAVCRYDIVYIRTKHKFCQHFLVHTWICTLCFQGNQCIFAIMCGLQTLYTIPRFMVGTNDILDDIPRHSGTETCLPASNINHF